MRKVKFRAWNKKNKRWIPSYNLIINDQGKLCCCYSDKNFGEWAIDYEINQYTGLKDKNGVEIFEGDIVKHFDLDTPMFVHEVEYRNGGFGYIVDKGKPYQEFISYANHKYLKPSIDCEVIGNLYENPELL